MNKISGLTLSRGDFEEQIVLNQLAISEVKWWKENVLKGFKNILVPKVSVLIFTDASNEGWGMVCDDFVTGGRWNEQEKNLHINVLELRGVKFALKCLTAIESMSHVRVRSDSMTAVTYMNKMGGTKSKLCLKEVKEIFEFMMGKNVWLSAEFIAGKDNIQADRASRKFNEDIEWCLEESVFSVISSSLGCPVIDLFASRLNNKVSRFASWQPDPDAETTDAFSITWNNDFFYAFPPFSLIPLCLKKCLLDQAEGILIAPIWPTQVWFPKLMRLLIAKPLVLPANCISLRGKQHPLKKMRLMACKLSGILTKGRDFRKVLSKSSQLHGGLGQQNSIRCILKSGIISVIDGIKIPCIVMKK